MKDFVMCNNINKVSSSYLCSNCGACKAICPKDAVSFGYTSMGRMFATVNEKCIQCGICLKVCPSIDNAKIHTLYSDKYYGNIIKMYVGRATNEEIFKNAQSGGVATALLEYLFNSHLIDASIVCKMSYGVSEPDVHAVVITQPLDLMQTQKSCYTPVDVLSVLRKTSCYKSIAVVGLPCHVEGIVSLQKVSKKFSNIKYKIGLVCDRTLSKTIHSSIVKNSKNVLIKWKGKGFTNFGRFYPYNIAPLLICSPGKRDKVLPNSYRFALKDFYTAPRCRLCYDKINVHADIVLGDPWRLDDVDERYGESLVLTRTSIGQDLIDKMQKQELLMLREYSQEKISQSQLIEERKLQVSAYSQAFSVFPHNVDSYLFHQKNDGFVASEKIEDAKSQLQSYISNEKLSKDEIIKKSIYLLKKAYPLHRKIRDRIFQFLKLKIK